MKVSNSEDIIIKKSDQDMPYFVQEHRKEIREIIYHIIYTKRDEIMDKYISSKGYRFIHIPLTPTITEFIELAEKYKMEDYIGFSVGREIFDKGVHVVLFGSIIRDNVRVRTVLLEVDSINPEKIHNLFSDDTTPPFWSLRRWFG